MPHHALLLCVQTRWVRGRLLPLLLAMRRASRWRARPRSAPLPGCCRCCCWRARRGKGTAGPPPSTPRTAACRPDRGALHGRGGQSPGLAHPSSERLLAVFSSLSSLVHGARNVHGARKLASGWTAAAAALTTTVGAFRRCQPPPPPPPLRSLVPAPAARRTGADSRAWAPPRLARRRTVPRGPRSRRCGLRRRRVRPRLLPPARRRREREDTPCRPPHPRVCAPLYRRVSKCIWSCIPPQPNPSLPRPSYIVAHPAAISLLTAAPGAPRVFRPTVLSRFVSVTRPL